MAKKIQAYIDAPIKEHHDLHTGGIAYVVYAPYVDEQVRCVTLVDHEGDKHESVFTESEVREIAQKMNRILAFGRTESSNKAVASMLALHGIVLDPA